MIPTINVTQREALQWEAYAMGYCGNQEPVGTLQHYYSAGHASGFFCADGRASLIIDNVRKIVILTFRGSANCVNGFNDIRVDQESLQGITNQLLQEPLKNKRVHAGFACEYNALRNRFEYERMYDVLQAIVCQSDWHILLTGHSLGGALATLSAADLLLRGAFNANKIALITFGSPRVGDCAFSEWIDQAGFCQNIRVEIDYDPVVSVPAQNGGAYWHRGCLSRIQLDGGIYRRMHHDENPGEFNGPVKKIGNVLAGSIGILPSEVSNYITSGVGIAIDFIGSMDEWRKTNGVHVPYLCHMGYWGCQEYREQQSINFGGIG